ncbi:hypothetical protein B0I35DRAFT_425272 [Stachybotrys elegans]|uniref:Secreted protein n=1 Tax=Stachybotrys elegans TaxID=80388 RepID=A0A8K0WVZ9_9HYPO|nr:hypothetical protein B0I35DRAFT_425272 [Stachybotrys elegans]
MLAFLFMALLLLFMALGPLWQCAIPVSLHIWSSEVAHLINFYCNWATRSRTLIAMGPKFSQAHGNFSTCLQLGEPLFSQHEQRVVEYASHTAFLPLYHHGTEAFVGLLNLQVVVHATKSFPIGEGHVFLGIGNVGRVGVVECLNTSRQMNFV